MLPSCSEKLLPIFYPTKTVECIAHFCLEQSRAHISLAQWIQWELGVGDGPRYCKLPDEIGYRLWLRLLSPFVIVFKAFPFTTASSALYKEKRSRFTAVTAVHRVEVGQRSRYCLWCKGWLRSEVSQQIMSVLTKDTSHPFQTPPGAATLTSPCLHLCSCLASPPFPSGLFFFWASC